MQDLWQGQEISVFSKVPVCTGDTLRGGGGGGVGEGAKF